MFEVIFKAIGYLLLIFMGYFLKKIGKFSPQDKATLGTILMYITLPCAFVANFRYFQFNSSLFLFFVIGLTANIIAATIGKIISAKKASITRAEYMIQGSGYNIGAFTTPFVGSVMDPYGTVVSSIFDIGNSIMCIGLIYPLGKKEVDSEKRSISSQIKFMAGKLFGSVPFDTYLVMLIISLLGIRLPDAVSNVAAALGAPSIIITMIMVGIALEIHVSKEDLKDIISILGIRYILSAVLAALVLQIPFLSGIEKRALAYCLFAPTTSISPTYAGLCGCKSSVYGAVSSISIVISLIGFVTITAI